MSHALLGDPEIPLPGSRQQLGVDEKVVALDRHLLDNFAAHQLEGAVDIADPKPEHDTHQTVVDPRQDASDDRVIAIDAEPCHDFVIRHQWHEVFELRDVELIVGIGEKYEFVAGVPETGA